MQRCALTSNRAFLDGGAIFNTESDTTMMTCNLTSNEAIDSGGAVYEVFGTAQMDFCRFVGNVATVGWAFSSAEHRGPVAIRNSFFFFDFDNAPSSDPAATPDFISTGMNIDYGTCDPGTTPGEAGKPVLIRSQPEFTGCPFRCPEGTFGPGGETKALQNMTDSSSCVAVSYTHLTLPTILLV